MSSPFLRALGPDAAKLAPVVAALHAGSPRYWTGRVTVRRREGVLAAFACRVAGFPRSMQDAPFGLDIEVGPETEIWTRDFDGHIMRSVLRLTQTGLSERLGVIDLGLCPEFEAGMLSTRVTDAHVFGIIPLPRFALPHGDVRLYQDKKSRYCFDIVGFVPVLGEVIRYSGWLLADPSSR
ncbi:MAG: DUF4166 domain-containing protein [Aliishimia sp.]